MKMPEHCQVWEACSKDAGRPALTYVYFDAKAGTLLATNSYIAAVVPVDVEKGDQSGMIPAEALKAAAKTASRSVRVSKDEATVELADGRRVWKLGQGQFPDIAAVFERALAIESPFGYNPELVRDLGMALGVKKGSNFPLILHPVRPLSPTLVEGRDGSKGVLMPVRLTSSLEPRAFDLSNDAAIVAAARAAIRKLAQRRGAKQAAAAFRAALLAAVEGS